MIYSALLTLHIISGFAALIGAAGAILTQLLDAKHQWHIYSGRIFFWGMVLVFLTTLPMALLRPNLFLLLIGIFSFYLAWSGWRMAVNRKGKAGPQDLLAIFVMGTTAMLMIGWGGWILFTGDGNGITLIVFGAIGGVLSLSDIHRYTKGPVKGKDRITAHLISMLAATIAAITAFMVVNFQTEPVWVVWIAPTVLITPFIFWMNKKIHTGKSGKYIRF